MYWIHTCWMWTYIYIMCWATTKQSIAIISWEICIQCIHKTNRIHECVKCHVTLWYNYDVRNNTKMHHDIPITTLFHHTYTSKTVCQESIFQLLFLFYPDCHDNQIYAMDISKNVDFEENMRKQIFLLIAISAYY